MAGKDKLSPESALQLNELLQRIEAIDLGKVAAEREEAKTQVEKMVTALEKNQTYRRVVKGSKRAPGGKQHWKVRRKRARMYYAEKGSARRRERIAESLKTPEGWWKYIMKGWRENRKVTIYLTYEQFLEHIYPWIEQGRVVNLKRISSLKGLSLDNLVVRDVEGEVLFDGSEYELRRRGYIL